MKFGAHSIKFGPLTLAVLTAVNLQISPALAQSTGSSNSSEATSGVLPAPRNTQTEQLIDDLFPPLPATNPVTTPPNNSNGNAGNGASTPGNSGHSINPPNTTTPAPGTTSPTTPPTTPPTTGTTTPPANSAVNTPRPSNVKDDFKCNLFVNPSYEDVLSAVNALNAAVNMPSCASGKIDPKAIAASNSKISAAVTKLHGFVSNPSTVQQAQIPDIVNNVDIAVQETSNIANTFSHSELLSKGCRSQMSPGKVALAINDLVNGLTPFALMAASMAPGVGTAAIPFIVGTSVVTDAISSMAQIIQQNTPNMNDPSVRRAVVENTCQFIRLDQKYKFLLQNRNAQVLQINKDVTTTKVMFSAKLNGFSSQVNALIDQKAALDQTSSDMNKALTKAKGDLNLYQNMINQNQNSPTSDMVTCQMGIQLANTPDPKKTSFVSVIMNSLDTAIIAYGSSDDTPAQALKASAKLALSGLQQAATQQYTATSTFTNCASSTKSFLSILSQAGDLSTNMVSLAETNLDTQLQATGQYTEIESRLDMLNQKRNQANRLADALPNLSKYATSLQRSDMDANMDQLRIGIFSTTTSGKAPIMAWFDFFQGLHNQDLNNFIAGLNKLRDRAFNLTPSAKINAGNNPIAQLANNQNNMKDHALANNLGTLDLKHLPVGTSQHADACREMQGVMNTWLASLDHLDAIGSFCSMIDRSIYDTKPQDKDLVQYCRGHLQTNNTYTGSTVSSMAANLKNNHWVQWGNFLQAKIDALLCYN